jgi:hypothetical protein
MSEAERDRGTAGKHPVLFQVGAWSLIAGVLLTSILAWLLRGFTPWSGAPILLGLVVFIGTAFGAAALDRRQHNGGNRE